MNKREALSRVALFSKLNEKDLNKLADMSVPKTFPADTLLIKEGTVGLGMFIITSGRVEVYRGEGENRTTLAVLESGTIVGEMALINDQYRSANVRSLEQTECLLVSQDAFRTLIRQEPEVALSVMAVLADRMRDSQNKIHELQNKVNQTVAEVKEGASQDWTAEEGVRSEREAPRRARGATRAARGATRVEERYEDEVRTETRRAVAGPVQHMMEAQRLALQAGSEVMNTWSGMMGTFLGGMARMADSKVGAVRVGIREGSTTVPRRFFKSFTGAIDEGMQAYEDVVTGGAPPPDESRPD